MIVREDMYAATQGNVFTSLWFLDIFRLCDMYAATQ